MLTNDQLPKITDEQMYERLTTTREYTLVVLKTTPLTFDDESGTIIWEHGRRNLALQAAGALAIICPATDGSDVAGIGIFSASPEAVRPIIEGDPAVESGVLTYELHRVCGFPGDTLH